MAKKLKIKISELNQKSNITGFEYMPSSYIANTSECWKSYKIGTTQLATYIGNNLDTFELSDDIEGLYAYLNDVKAYHRTAYAYNRVFNENITEKASDWAGAYNGYFDAHYVGNVSKLGTYITSNIEGFHMNATEVDGKGIRIGASWDKDSDDDIFTYIPVAGDTTYGLITLTDVMKAFGDGDMTFPVASDTVSGCISTSEVRDIVSNFKHPFSFTLSHTNSNITLAYNCDGSYKGSTTIPKATYNNYGVVNLSNLKTIASSYSKGISYNIDFVLTYNIENVYNCPPMTQSTAGSVTYNRVKDIAFNIGHDFFIRNISDSEGNSVLQYSFDGGNTYKDAVTFPSVDYTMPLYGMVSETVMKNAANKALMAVLGSDDLKAGESKKGLVNGLLLQSITEEAAKDFKTWFVPGPSGQKLQLGTYYGSFSFTDSPVSEEATIEKFNGTTYGLTTYADIENYLSDNYTLSSNNIVTNITPKLFYGTSGVEFEVTYNMSSDPGTTCYITDQSMKFNKIDNTVTDKNIFGVINLAYFNQVMSYTLGYWKNQAKEEYDKYQYHDLNLKIGGKTDDSNITYVCYTDLNVVIYDGIYNNVNNTASIIYTPIDKENFALTYTGNRQIIQPKNVTKKYTELKSDISKSSKFSIVVTLKGLYKSRGSEFLSDTSVPGYQTDDIVQEIIVCDYDNYITKQILPDELSTINIPLTFTKNTVTKYRPILYNTTNNNLVVDISTSETNIMSSFGNAFRVQIPANGNVSDYYCGNQNTKYIKVNIVSGTANYVDIDKINGSIKKGDPTDVNGWGISNGNAICNIEFGSLGTNIPTNYTITFKN